MLRPNNQASVVLATLVTSLLVIGVTSCGTEAGIPSSAEGPRIAADDEGGGTACIRCHPTPPEDSSMKWDQAPGDHDRCAKCHSAQHGSKPVPPESVCLNCHQGDWREKHTASATQCLKCHLWPHVPLDIELKPGIHNKHKAKGVQCFACHKMMGGIMPSREKCMACHNKADETKHSRGALCSICHKS